MLKPWHFVHNGIFCLSLTELELHIIIIIIIITRSLSSVTRSVREPGWKCKKKVSNPQDCSPKLQTQNPSFLCKGKIIIIKKTNKQTKQKIQSTLLRTLLSRMDTSLTRTAWIQFFGLWVSVSVSPEETTDTSLKQIPWVGPYRLFSLWFAVRQDTLI